MRDWIVGRTGEEVKRASNLIPAGPPLEQSIFKDAFALAYGSGKPILQAMEIGLAEARKTDASFDARYATELLTL